MEPTALVAGVIALLSPYVRKSAEEFAGEAGKAAYQKTGELWNWLKTKLSPQAGSALKDFESDPTNHAAALERVLNEESAQDRDFAARLEQFASAVKAMAPSVSVVIKMNEAEEIVGVRLRELRRGHVRAEIEVDRAKKIVGFDGDSM